MHGTCRARPHPPRSHTPRTRLALPRTQPAEAEGVKLGDRLLSIDGHSLAGKRIRDVFAERIAAGEWPAARHELVLLRVGAAPICRPFWMRDDDEEEDEDEEDRDEEEDEEEEEEEEEVVEAFTGGAGPLTPAASAAASDEEGGEEGNVTPLAPPLPPPRRRDRPQPPKIVSLPPPPPPRRCVLDDDDDDLFAAESDGEARARARWSSQDWLARQVAAVESLPEHLCPDSPFPLPRPASPATPPTPTTPPPAGKRSSSFQRLRRLTATKLRSDRGIRGTGVRPRSIVYEC
jgi:hypothetical protein